METYRVVSITDRKGNPRIEGRCPLRVGRMCKKPTPRNGDAMMIEWLAQPDGTPYVGMIVTSTVIGFKTEDKCFRNRFARMRITPLRGYA